MDRVTLLLTVFAVGIALALLVRRRRLDPQRNLSSQVCEQHIDLLQGGELRGTAVAAAKQTLQRLLRHGATARVEESLKPGLQFAVQVHALAEIGTAAAGDILERQLQRQRSDHAVEEAWYLLDLTQALRRLERVECLPTLLCRFGTGDLPLAHFLAAEIVSFDGFQRYLTRPATATGRRALGVLHQALVGLRSGVPPELVATARLGAAVETVWDHRSERVEPLAVRVFLESLRFSQRSSHALRALRERYPDIERFQVELRRLADIGDALEDYLQDARNVLCAELEQALPRSQADILRALMDLRVDTASVVIPMIETGRLTALELGIESLAWARTEYVGEWLCSLYEQEVGRDAARIRVDRLPTRLAIIKMLRQFPSERAEAILRAAAASPDPRLRTAAVGSLGWWEPIQRQQVLERLQWARFAPQAEIHEAAHAALARLGERRALQWFRQRFASEHLPAVHRAIQSVADEGIVLLWPDLDRLADAEDTDVAYHAREALEQLRETGTSSQATH